MRNAVAALAAALASCASVPERPPTAARGDEPALEARCGRGFAVDCRSLGRALISGDDVARDDRVGAAHLMQACEMGDPAGCADLGVCYAIGRGVAQSDERAAALSRRACDQGAAVACSNLGALLAEGAAPAAAGEGPQARSGRIVRLFRTACDAGVPEGCANLGTALEAGSLAPRDPRGAARGLRRACDGGLALACHRLALLVRERADVAPDLAPAELEARACRGAIASACLAPSETPPPTGRRTPAARLVEDPRSYALGVPGMGGFSPGELSTVPSRGPKRALEDVRRPPEPLLAAVPPELRARLGIDLTPRRADAGDPAVELLLALRRHQLGQCYESPRASRRPATEGYAVFFVTADGRPLEVRAAASPADAPLEACLAELASGWEFPASPEGVAGPYLVRYAFDADPAVPPEYAGPGSLRPAPRDPACVERELRVPPELRGSAGSVTVKLAVDPAGAPSLLHALTPAPDALLAAVAAAVGRCAWAPGTGPDGARATLWVTLTVKLDAR